MASENVEMAFTGLQINPLDHNETAVDLERASITVAPGREDASPALDWRTLIESIGGGIALLPGTGVIRHLDMCFEECRAGDLSWFRNADAIKVYINVPEEHLQGSLLLSAKKSTASLTRYRNNLFIAEMVFLTGNTDHLNITGHARFLSSEPRLHFEARQPLSYAIDITSLEAELDGTLPLDGTLSAASIGQQLEGRLTLTSRLGWQVDVADTTLSSQQTIALKTELNKGKIRSSLTSPVSITVENPIAQNASLIVAAGSQCTVNINDRSESNSGKADCTSPDVAFAGTLSTFLTTASMSSVHWGLDTENWQLSAAVDVTVNETAASTVNITGLEEKANLMSATLNLTANNEVMIATTDSATVLGVDAINLKINQNLQTDKGELLAQLEKPAIEFEGLIKNQGVQGLNIDSGELSLNLDLAWNLTSNTDDLDLDANISVQNLNMDFDGYEFHNASIDTSLTGWPRIASQQPGSMTWDKLDVGVPITNLAMRFDLNLLPEEDNYELTGISLKANVFGGSMGSDEYAYNLTREHGHLMLNLDRLELQQILDLQEEEFESSGKISGSVPVHIKQGKLSVSKGSVTAIEPGGTIKYKPSPSVAGLVAQNDQLKVIVDTMSDFQYHSLEAILEYSPEGDLVARTALKGSNQAFENGREVHLNVNLEENLADLLKSLRLANRVSTGVTRKAKDGTR